MNATDNNAAAKAAIINLRFHQHQILTEQVQYTVKIVVSTNDRLRTALEKASEKLVSLKRTRRINAGEVDVEDITVDNTMKRIKRVECNGCIDNLLEFIDEPEATLAALNTDHTRIFDGGLDVYLSKKLSNRKSTTNKQKSKTSRSSKRRKIQATDASSQSTICVIYDLIPGGILKEVAKFLAPPSRILFATAITPPPSTPYDRMMCRFRPSISRSSIAGDEWHTLDFGEIEEELAAKLSDEDIRKVLLHIDAANKVKRLFLTNCTNITGSCLSPLLGCTSIEQIDLSLVGVHKSPRLDPLPPLSSDLVLPILQSIISQERNSLKHLQFPHDWRAHKILLDEIVECYTEMISNRNTTSCDTCFQSIDMNGCMQRNFGAYGCMRNFGAQDHTCCVCTKNVCEICTVDENNMVVCFEFCSTCDRYFCFKCSELYACSSCDNFLCGVCKDQNQCSSPFCTEDICNYCHSINKCRNCEESWCNGCFNGTRCDNCSEVCCEDCSRKEGVNGVHDCNDCRTQSPGRMTLCDRCRVAKCQSGEIDCKSCTQIVAPILLEENMKMRAQIEALEDKNEASQDDIKVLKDEVENLMRELYRVRVSSQNE